MSAWLPHGTAAWFHMAGTLMCEAAARAGLPADLEIGLVERYIDGVDLSAGLVQGLRFDIKSGQPSFRVGAGPDEGADITVEITAAASHELNSLYSDDPRFETAVARLKKHRRHAGAGRSCPTGQLVRRSARPHRGPHSLAGASHRIECNLLHFIQFHVKKSGRSMKQTLRQPSSRLGLAWHQHTQLSCYRWHSARSRAAGRKRGGLPPAIRLYTFDCGLTDFKDADVVSDTARPHRRKQ